MQGYSWEQNKMQIGVVNIQPTRKRPALTITREDGVLLPVASFKSEETAELFIKAFEQFIGLSFDEYNKADQEMLWGDK